MAYGAIIGQKATQTAAQTSYNNNSTSSIISSNNVQGAIDNLTSNTNSRINSLNTQVGSLNSQVSGLNNTVTNLSQTVNGKASVIIGSYYGTFYTHDSAYNQPTQKITIGVRPSIVIIWSQAGAQTYYGYDYGGVFSTTITVPNYGSLLFRIENDGFTVGAYDLNDGFPRLNFYNYPSPTPYSYIAFY